MAINNIENAMILKIVMYICVGDNRDCIQSAFIIHVERAAM